MSETYSFPKEKIKILLLEGIHEAAADVFRGAGYTAVETSDKALGEEDLLETIQDIHILGIRSKTKVSGAVLERARSLLAVGCFCIGTNTVELMPAARKGVVVFNAPYSNTRSVAELTMAEVVMLARRTFERSWQMHEGQWNKSAQGSFEVKSKTLGVIGYGHIGEQVGLLAEAFGMRVVFFDIVSKLALGNAVQLNSLEELLRIADFVTLHVPETQRTRGMISKHELQQMKKGACLLNLARGSVVDVAAVKEALVSGHLGGAAVDVFPQEPKSNKDPFTSELQGLKNVILTPHVGGSTVEAQRNIGIEVSRTLVKYIETGSSTGAVNFPNVELPLVKDSHRVLNVHRNVPGVLGKINGIFAELAVNIDSQYLGTNNEIGYLIVDVGRNVSREVKKRIDAVEESIRTRLLF